MSNGLLLGMFLGCIVGASITFVVVVMLLEKWSTPGKKMTPPLKEKEND